MSSVTSWLKFAPIGLGAIFVSGPGLAEEPQLTPYEQSLACKFSQTCSEADRSLTDRDSAGDGGEIVGEEAPFQVFNSAPQERSAATPRGPAQGASRQDGSKPKLYVANRPAKALASAAGSSPDKRRSRNIASQPGVVPRKNAGEMNVLFANASAELDAADMREIKAWSNVFKTSGYSGMRLRIEGHTNLVGSREYNVELSERRAKAVMDYMIGQGIAADRIEAKGFGFNRPRAADPQSGVNRRVEIVKFD